MRKPFLVCCMENPCIQNVTSRSVSRNSALYAHQQSILSVGIKKLDSKSGFSKAIKFSSGFILLGRKQ